MSFPKITFRPLVTRDFQNSSDVTNLNNTASTNHTQPNSPLPASDQFLQSPLLFSEELTNEKEANRASSLGESNNELEEFPTSLAHTDPPQDALFLAHRKISELEEKIEQLLQEKQGLNQDNTNIAPNIVSLEKYREMEENLQKYHLLIESYSFENKNIGAKLSTYDAELLRAKQENMMLKVQIENILNVLNISEENKEELWEDIEGKELYISKIEKYINELKVSHVAILEDIKESLTKSSLKNNELCASLQQKSEEVANLQLNLTNLNKAKEEVTAHITQLTQNNEALEKEIVEYKKSTGQYKVENTQLKALLHEKCNQTEELLQTLKKKEQLYSATSQKNNLLEVLFKQTSSENKDLKAQIQDLQTQATFSPYCIEPKTRKTSKTPDLLAKTERKEQAKVFKENKTKSLRGDESSRQMLQFLRDKKKLSEGSNSSLINKALKTLRSKSPKSHPVSEDLSPLNNSFKNSRRNRCLTEWEDESSIAMNYQIWPSTTKTSRSPHHKYFPSAKTPTTPAAAKSYDVSYAVEALKQVEESISLIVNHLKSILSGFENVKVTDIIARKVTVIDQWKERLSSLEKLHKEIVKDRTRNGSRERNRREDHISLNDLKESFVVFRDNGYIHVK